MRAGRLAIASTGAAEAVFYGDFQRRSAARSIGALGARNLESTDCINWFVKELWSNI